MDAGDYFAARTANKTARADENLSHDQITEEVVADAFGTMIKDTKLFEEFATGHKAEAVTLRDALHDLRVKIEDILSGKIKLFRQQQDVFKSLKDSASEMEELLNDALITASEKALASTEMTASTDKEAGERTSKAGVYENSKDFANVMAAVQKIDRKSVDDFTSQDIKSTSLFAQKYWAEMGAKSPFFRAWFGDWRANDTIPVQVATEKGSAKGLQHNDDPGWDINVSGKVFAESQHFANRNQTAISYLPYINDIVKKAVLLDSFTMGGRTKSANSLLMHSLYSVADIGNGPEVLKLYVEEMNDPNSDNTAKRAYQLQNIEKASAQGGGVRGNTLSSLAPSADAVSTVADLFKAVKDKDKNFKPKETSKITNPDGTPMVVYHGTDAEFNVFDSSKSRANMDIQGSFFSPWEIDAGGYGNNVRAFYLNVKNPAPESVAYKALNRFKGQNEAGIKAKDYLIGLGYDGVNNSDEEFIAFYPTQIKSATDNIGTFDRNNPDIRYSKAGVYDNVEDSDKKRYAGKKLSDDASLYTYDFLTSLPDMKTVTLTDVSNVTNPDGGVNRKTVLKNAEKNLAANGYEKNGKYYIENSYTGREIRVDVESVRHGLEGNYNRLLTNARISSSIGEAVKNAVPINALKNKAEEVSGTYETSAMVSYATDTKGREFISVITVEQRTNEVSGIETYDVAHAVTGRQKNSSQVDTKSQGVYPLKATKISISNLIGIVKHTYQSILSEDVLSNIGEQRNPNGNYADKVKFSKSDTYDVVTAGMMSQGRKDAQAQRI